MILLGILIMFGIVLLAVILARSFKAMNYASIAYAAFIIALSVYLLGWAQLPLKFLNSHYFFIDTLGAFEIMVTGIIFFLAAVYAGGYIKCLIDEGELSKTNVMLFYLGFNSLLFCMVMAFSSNNLSLLWIFAELTTILSAVLIVTLNAKDNIIAAMKYVFITSTAMLISFIGFIFLFAASKNITGGQTLNWDALMQASQQIPPQMLLFSFVFILIGFAAKSGIFPFHTWLPPSHSKAASDVSVLLSSGVLNIGIYAIIRVYALVAPSSMGHIASNIMLLLGVLTVGIASFSMLTRTNLKKLFAFSSIENMGFLLIGIVVGNIYWVLFYILAHSLVKALLFFSAGIIHRQYGSIIAKDINNLFKLQPLAAAGLIIGSIAIIGTPLLPIFVPKILILASLAKTSLALPAIVLLFLLVAAGSYAWIVIRIVTQQGKTTDQFHIFSSMKIPIVILILILLVLGIYPPPALANIAAQISSQLGFAGSAGFGGLGGFGG
jgi:hydrogenase-4 component F